VADEFIAAIQITDEDDLDFLSIGKKQNDPDTINNSEVSEVIFFSFYKMPLLRNYCSSCNFYRFWLRKYSSDNI
jgi:hypothetical protein